MGRTALLPRYFLKIFLLLLLTVLFVNLYRFLSPGEANGGAAAGATHAELSQSSLALVIVPTFFILLAFFVWRARGISKLSVNGVALLDQGRYLEALAIFEQVLRKSRASPLAVYNVGVAKLLLWRVAEADASFEKAAQMSHLMMDIRGLLVPYRAFIAAILGREKDAQVRLSECESLRVAETPHASLARAILAARGRRWAEAQALLARSEVRALGGVSRGFAEALRVWAIEQQGGAPRSVDRIGLFNETGPDAFKICWPEFHDFLLRAPAA